MQNLSLKVQNQKKIEKIYVVSVVVAMGLLFFSNAEEQWTPDGNTINLGLDKSFYIPCAVAFVCSFLLEKGHDIIDSLIHAFVIIACFSTLLHPQELSNVLTWTTVRLFFGVFCFIRLRYVDIELIIKYSAIAAPFIVFPHYIVTNPFEWGDMRYGGCYGDPNYLSMALNFLNLLCFLYCRKGSNRIIKTGALVSILGTIPLIMFGMSRGGLIGLCAILIFMMIELFKKSKSLFAIILLSLCYSSTSFMSKMSSNIDNISMRFSGESYNDVRSSELRLEGIESGLTVLLNKPSLIPFGIGPGNTIPHIDKYRQYGYYTHVIIHSTPFAVLYEIGIFAFFILIYVFYVLFKRLFNYKRYLQLVIFATTTISVLTLQALVFMPFWIILFTLSNKDYMSNK